MKNNQHCNETYLLGEAEEISEVRITLENFRVQYFWPDKHGIAHYSGTKPLGRGKQASQGEHEVDRTYKQWTLRYTGFKNGQLGEGNRYPMKLLTRVVQPNELLSLENAIKNAQMENIFQSKKSQSNQQTQENALWKLKSKNHKNLDLRKKNQEKMSLLHQRLYKNYLKLQKFKKQYQIKEKNKREQLYCNKNGEIYRRLWIQEYKKPRITGSKKRISQDLYNQEIPYYQTNFIRQ